MSKKLFTPVNIAASIFAIVFFPAAFRTVTGIEWEPSNWVSSVQDKIYNQRFAKWKAKEDKIYRQRNIWRKEKMRQSCLHEIWFFSDDTKDQDARPVHVGDCNKFRSQWWFCVASGNRKAPCIGHVNPLITKSFENLFWKQMDSNPYQHDIENHLKNKPRR